MFRLYGLVISLGSGWTIKFWVMIVLKRDNILIQGQIRLMTGLRNNSYSMSKLRLLAPEIPDQNYKLKSLVILA